MSFTSPSENLKRIVNFIVNFYAPAWFYIKSHESCQDGARNFFFLIQLYKDLSARDQEIIIPVLKNNAYYAHPESILLSAVSDENEIIRKFAVEKINTLKDLSSVSDVRLFDKRSIPLNLAATSYIEMIHWSDVQVTVPPLLTDHIHKWELSYEQPLILDKYPCHSQSVERNIKDVSEVSLKVRGHISRHGMIIQCKKSRLDIPKIESKADFNMELNN